jgi:hypothetical protein
MKHKLINYLRFFISDFVIFFVFVAVQAVVGAVEHVLGVADAFLARLKNCNYQIIDTNYKCNFELHKKHEVNVC